MEISDIVLQQIPEEEFAQLHRLWYPQSTIIEQCNKAMILNPLSFYSYNNLIEWFLKNPKSHSTNIYDKGKWKKYKKRELDDIQISELKSKKEHNLENLPVLDLIFNIRTYQSPRLKIRFCRNKENYIGYTMLFAQEAYHKLSWISRPNFKERIYVHGLSNPRS